MDHGLRSNLLKVEVISVSLHTVERQIRKILTYVIRSDNDLTTSRGLLHICQANSCITAGKSLVWEENIVGAATIVADSRV